MMITSHATQNPVERPVCVGSGIVVVNTGIADLFTFHIERNILHIWGLDYTLHIKSCRLQFYIYPNYTFYFIKHVELSILVCHLVTKQKIVYNFLTSRCSFSIFFLVYEMAISNMNNSLLQFIIYYL